MWACSTGKSIPNPTSVQPRGSVLSPLLGNVYLHNVLDLWFEREVKPRLRGAATLHRYCDDFVMCFEQEADARRVMEVLGKRMGRYGLTLHPDKTRLLPFAEPPRAQTSGKGPATFDFLGFTMYWKRTRWGRWRMQCKTRRARLSRAIVTIGAWCRRHRHQPIKAQHAALKRRIQGHINYFGVNGNFERLTLVVEEAKRSSFRWLQRRSQQRHLISERFSAILNESAACSARYEA